MSSSIAAMKRSMKRGDRPLDLLEALAGLAEQLPVERERRAVVGDAVEPPNHVGPVLGQLRNPDHVAERLAHLDRLAVLVEQLQVSRVHPVADPRVPAQRLGLGDLVLVMRKQVVDPAAVHVEVLTKHHRRHHRALDVPARPPARPLGLAGRPARLARLARLPQREVGEEALALALALVGPPARARLQILDRPARQLPVAREAAHVVEHLAVDHVGVALVDQRLHGLDLLGHEVGRAHVGGVVLDLERPTIGAKPSDDPLDVIELAGALLGRLGHDPIVDVGVVDDADDVVAAILEPAAEHVPKAVGPRVADVHVRVDRQPAGVDAYDLGVGRYERLLALGSGVVDVERHRGCLYMRRRRGGEEGTQVPTTSAVEP
jgi:hypothetical protein